MASLAVDWRRKKQLAKSVAQCTGCAFVPAVLERDNTGMEREKKKTNPSSFSYVAY